MSPSNAIEAVNVLIVIVLLFILIRKRDVATLLLILFVYGTLHFSFSAIALATNESANMLIAMHKEGGGVLAKLTALLLLGVVFVLLSWHAYKAFFLSQWSEKKIVIHILLVMVAILCGYYFSIRHGDWLQLKNVISIEAMLALLLIGFLGTIGRHTLNVTKLDSWGLGGLLILGVSDCVAFYEVFKHQSWAGTLESSGAMVYRASATLFNPNLFGFWASLVYLGCAYGMHAHKEYRKMMLWGMVLASIALYLSGSRSSGYLLFGVCFITMALRNNDRFHWLPLMVLPLTMLTIYAGAAWLVVPFVSSNEGWREITLLGERFAATPLYVVNYILLLAGVPAGVPAEVILSMEGRFIGEERDAGWVVLYQDVGWLGLAAAIWAACMLVVWGVRVYIARPTVSSVYALAVLFYCLLTGFVMRFQVFPVWMFTSLALIPCLVFWASSWRCSTSVDAR